MRSARALISRALSTPLPSCAPPAALPIPAGPLTLAPVEAEDMLTLRPAADGWHLSGVVRGVPWSREAKSIVVLADGMAASVAPTQAAIQRAANLAGEPR